MSIIHIGRYKEINVLNTIIKVLLCIIVHKYYIFGVMKLGCVGDEVKTYVYPLG